MNIGLWTLLQSWDFTARFVEWMGFLRKVHRSAKRKQLRRLSRNRNCTRDFCWAIAYDVLYFDAFVVHALLFESFFLVLRIALLISSCELVRGRRRSIFSVFFNVGASRIAMMTGSLKELSEYCNEVFDAFWPWGWRPSERIEFRMSFLLFRRRWYRREIRKSLQIG